MTSISVGLIPLHSLFSTPRFVESVVCHSHHGSLRWGELTDQVSALSGCLKRQSAQRWLLATDDPLAFLVRLLALLYSGKEVVIPPNTQPGTLAVLAGAYDARVNDLSCDLEGAGEPLSCIDPQDAIIVLYTSGSTGEPKRIKKTLAQFEAEIAVLESLWGATLGEASVLATAPHHHIYGLLFRLLWPLSSGRAFDAVTCAHPDTLEQRLAVLGESVLISSPAQLARMPELIPLAVLGPHLKAVFSSGGPLPAKAASAFHSQLGQAPIEVFGSTETGGIAWRCQSGVQGDDLWTPFPGLDVGCTSEGALLLRSPFVDGDAAQAMDDGVELMPDGRFRLLGRLDRVVKIEEKRLSLPDMEMRLIEHAWVDAAAVVSLRDRGQRIGAVLVLTAQGVEALEREDRRSVGQSLRAHLGAYFDAVLLPRHWRFVNQLPSNERGKLSYAELAGLFKEAESPVFAPDVLELRRESGSDKMVELDLHITPDLAHFGGHFPGLPILPGVVQIDWAVRFARQYLPIAGDFSALENTKFLALVLPDSRLKLSLNWDAPAGRLDFVYRGTDRKHSSGRVLFKGRQ